MGKHKLDVNFAQSNLLLSCILSNTDNIIGPIINHSQRVHVVYNTVVILKANQLSKAGRDMKFLVHAKATRRQ